MAEYQYNLTEKDIKDIAKACDILDSRQDYIKCKFGEQHWVEYFKFSITVFMIDPTVCMYTADYNIVEQVDKPLTEQQKSFIIKLCERLDKRVAGYYAANPDLDVNTAISDGHYTKQFQKIVEQYFKE